jgi:SlyX protein
MSTEDRVTELEMALAHQDQTINDLSDMINRQWNEIERLKRELQRLDSMKADRPPDEDQPPPHY